MGAGAGVAVLPQAMLPESASQNAACRRRIPKAAAATIAWQPERRSSRPPVRWPRYPTSCGGDPNQLQKGSWFVSDC